MPSHPSRKAIAAMFRGKAPTSLVGRRHRHGPAAEKSIRSVLDLAVRIGETSLSLGAAAADVAYLIEQVCRAYGVDCEVDLTYNSIHVVYDGDDETPGVGVLRVVDGRAPDYARLERVLALADEIVQNPEAEGVSADSTDSETRGIVRSHVEEAHVRLDEILDAPQRFRRGVVTLFLALMAAGVAILLGGGPVVVLLAAATTALVDFTIGRLAAWGMPPFFSQIAGAAVATLVAVAIVVAGDLLPEEFVSVPPTLVVASGIVVLLAGLSLVGAADDAINGFPLTAGARLMEVVLLTLGIVIGIVLVLDIARRLGVTLVIDETTGAPWPFPVQVVGAGIASAAWALSSYAGKRATLFVAALGAGAYAVFALIGDLGLPGPAATGLAAVLIGFLAESVGSRRFTVPVIVSTVCATVPLLPGLALYRGLLETTVGDGVQLGAEQLLAAGLVGTALAAGVTFGKFVARRLVTPADVMRRIEGSLFRRNRTDA